MARQPQEGRKFGSTLLAFAVIIWSAEIIDSKIITVDGGSRRMHRATSKETYHHLRSQMPPSTTQQQLTPPHHHYQHQSNYETLSVVMETNNKRHNRFIQVQSTPSIYPPHNVLLIEYECLPGETAGIEVEVWTVYNKRLHPIREYWKCSEHSRHSRRVFQTLQLPDGIVYQPDYLNRNVKIIDRVELSVWILSADLFRSRKRGYYDLAEAKARYSIQALPMYSRPRKRHHSIGCLTWEADIMLKYSGLWNGIQQCNKEKEVIDLMSFPVAFHSGFYGLSRDVPPYQEPGLKLLMDANINNPKFTISAYIYITEPCKHSMCSLIHRKTQYTNRYVTPLIFLKNEGQVFIQIEDDKGTYRSMINQIKLPLREWLQMVYVQDGRKWSVQFYTQSSPTTTHLVGRSVFVNDVRYNETNAFYHLGGSSAVGSFSGYMLEAKLWRNQALDPNKVATIPIDQLNYTSAISQYYHQSDRLHAAMETVFSNYKLKQQDSLKNRTSPNMNPLLANMAAEKSPHIMPSCDVWQQPVPKGQHKLWRLLQHSAAINNSYVATHVWLGHQLYQHALEILHAEGLGGMHRMIRLLKQASCYGDMDATGLLATVYNAGLGVQTNATKALIYWLVAAQGGSRLAMIALASKHHQGVDEVPIDMDYAFNYYYHVAYETVLDRTKHTASDISFEAVRLTDEHQLQTQTGETGDYFKWLKHQAKQGVADAQINLARMYYHGTAGVQRDMAAAAELYRINAEQNPADPIAQYDYAVLNLRSSIAQKLFWGSHGLKRNMEEAVTFYAETAQTHPKNKIALYDYGIVLIRGQGVEKDEKKGMEYLNKSAELGHGPAYTALGWYKLNIEHNDTAAAYYFEKGDQKGHRDAAHNLGYMYLAGRYPGQPVDRMKAFEYYAKAAKADHWDSGTKIAELYNQGNEQMSRDIVMAAAWARYVAEKNRDVAWVLRWGLDAYLKSSWSESLVYYAMAAEAGLEVGQFNIAYMCEENYGGIAEKYVDRDCAWKYWKLAAASIHPHLTSILKVADYHWYGYKNMSDPEKAVKFYIQAAETKQPHALFNLAFLLENGVKVKDEVLQRLGVPRYVFSSKNNMSKVIELYRMCRDGSEDGYFPCGLALLNLQLKQVWKEHNLSIQFASAFMVGLLTALAVASFFGYFGSSETPKNINNNNNNSNSNLADSAEVAADQQQDTDQPPATTESPVSIVATSTTSATTETPLLSTEDGKEQPSTSDSPSETSSLLS